MLSKILGTRKRRNTPRPGDAWSRLPTEYPDGPRELKHTLHTTYSARPDWFV